MQAVSVTSLASEMVDLVERRKADVVCVSATPPGAMMHARYLCKQLRRRFPKVKLVVGLWDVQGDLNKAKERIGCGATVVATLADAQEQIRLLIPAALAADRAAGAAGARSNGHARGRIRQTTRHMSMFDPLSNECHRPTPSTLGILFQTDLRLRSNDYDSQTRY